MLKISKEQLQHFGALAHGHFVEETAEQLKRFLVPPGRRPTPRTLRTLVESGIRRAHVHGFDQRGPVRLYIEIMFILGSDFDSDPQFPWAAAILGQASTDDTQMERASELFDATQRYLEATTPPDGSGILEALQRALASGLEPTFEPRAKLDSQLLEQLEALGPEKAARVGERGLRELIRSGRARARTRGARTQSDEALIVFLMFGLGHGCMEDPLFPWIASSLSSRRRDPFARLRRTALHLTRSRIKHLSRRDAFPATGSNGVSE